MEKFKSSSHSFVNEVLSVPSMPYQSQRNHNEPGINSSDSSKLNCEQHESNASISTDRPRSPKNPSILTIQPSAITEPRPIITNSRPQPLMPCHSHPSNPSTFKVPRQQTPLNDACLYQLANLYEAHLHYPNPQTSLTPCWTNLIRGLLNNYTWTHCWANMLTNAIAKTMTNSKTRQIMMNLLQQNFFLTPLLRLPTINHHTILFLCYPFR